MEDAPIRYVLIDSWLLTAQASLNSENYALAVGNTMRDLAHLSREHNLTILLVAHPAKLYTKREERKIQLGDLKGSSDIKQEANNVISVERPDPDTNVMAAHLLKIRSDTYSRAIGTRIRFQYIYDTRRLTELSTTPERSK